jgi:arginine N-succinyltransferase
MAFILRSVEDRDVRDLQVLSSQFTMINLPNDAKVLAKKIEKSQKSFAGLVKDKSEAEYLFVVEDLETERVVGSSLILAKHGTKNAPHFYFKVHKKEHFSSDLGIGFVHQVLKLEEEKDGPTEIGGLLVDTEYRRVPEKIGKQISLVRFLYMAMNPERFEKKLLCELSPPQMAQGKSEFWEAVGRRFTGLPYKEADRLSHQYKEFIHSLFPKEEIYTCVLSSAARFVLGRVGDETRPAQHLLEKLGFKYLNEVDPFDGGPHFGVLTNDVPLIKNALHVEISSTEQAEFKNFGLVGLTKDGKFTAIHTAYHLNGDRIVLPAHTKEVLKVSANEKVCVTEIV